MARMVCRGALEIIKMLSLGNKRCEGFTSLDALISLFILILSLGGIHLLMIHTGQSALRFEKKVTHAIQTKNENIQTIIEVLE